MYTLESVSLPAPLRAFNAAGALARRAGLRAPSLGEASVIAAARARTGLADFGDPSFLDPLRILLSDVERDATLSAMGRFAVRYELVGHLTNRLALEALWRERPAILSVPVRRPIVIVGLPRTGTTLLHGLLGSLPGARAPRAWELRAPVPPPSAATAGSDPRIARAESVFGLLRRVAPAVEVIHPLGAREPEECVFLLQNAVAAMSWLAMADVPRYADWLLEAPLHAAYRHYRAQLQVLLADHPGDLIVLKSPCHLYALDALLEALPDACIVHTHRDLRDVMPSCLSLFGAYRLLFGRGVDLAAVGPGLLEFWARATEKALMVRRRADPGRFYDLRYRELVADPVGAAGRLLEHFGLPCESGARAAMGAWLRSRPKERPAHRYSLAQFGVTEAELRRRFALYLDAFGAPNAWTARTPKTAKDARE